MPFFQNPFPTDFKGYWVLADRQASLTFECPRNTGRGPESVTTWAQGPYNLSGNDADGNSKAVLTLSFCIGVDYKNWSDFPITITGASLSAIYPSEIVASMNATAGFSDWFKASLQTFGKNDSGTEAGYRIVVTQTQPQTKMRFYVKNGRAESVLRFNKLAGVADLPAYFARHTIANRYAYSDAQNALIQLATTGEDANVINNAVDFKGNSLGFSASNVLADYALLRGRSGLFMFTKNTVDGSNRITASIIYQAGAVAGDAAKKIQYTYSGANTSPSSVIEIPYVLASGDIMTPS